MEVPSDSTVPTDGAALCAYQYFENVRNFVIGLQDLGLPTFEASDLEKVKMLFHLSCTLNNRPVLVNIVIIVYFVDYCLNHKEFCSKLKCLHCFRHIDLMLSSAIKLITGWARCSSCRLCSCSEVT